MSDKPVIVLIHGHGVDSSMWNPIYDELASEYRIIKPDFSKQTTFETIEVYAEELFNLLKDAQVQSCVLLGHSMGGYIVLAFAEKHPELVSGLILLNSTAFADDEAKMEGRKKAVKTIQEHGSAPFIEQTIPKMFSEAFNKSHPEAVKQYVAQFSELPSAALIAGVMAMALRPDRTHVLQNAQFPVLIIAGQQDQIIPFDKSKELFAAAPKAKTVVLENAGHLGVIESPDEVVKAIQNFVSGL